MPFQSTRIHAISTSLYRCHFNQLGSINSNKFIENFAWNHREIQVERIKEDARCQGFTWNLHPNNSRSNSLTQKYDGTDANEPVYLAVKGVGKRSLMIVFDVTPSRDMYVPGKGYSCFAGKDASKALGKSSLNPADCIADFSDLTPEEVNPIDLDGDA